MHGLNLRGLTQDGDALVEALDGFLHVFLHVAVIGADKRADVRQRPRGLDAERLEENLGVPAAIGVQDGLCIAVVFLGMILSQPVGESPCIRIECGVKCDRSAIHEILALLAGHVVRALEVLDQGIRDRLRPHLVAEGEEHGHIEENPVIRGDLQAALVPRVADVLLVIEVGVEAADLLGPAGAVQLTQLEGLALSLVAGEVFRQAFRETVVLILGGSDLGKAIHQLMKGFVDENDGRVAQRILVGVNAMGLRAVVGAGSLGALGTEFLHVARHRRPRRGRRPRRRARAAPRCRFGWIGAASPRGLSASSARRPAQGTRGDACVPRGPSGRHPDRGSSG